MLIDPLDEKPKITVYFETAFVEMWRVIAVNSETVDNTANSPVIIKIYLDNRGVMSIPFFDGKSAAAALERLKRAHQGIIDGEQTE